MIKKLFLLIFFLIQIIFLSACNKSEVGVTEISFSSWGSKSEIETVKLLINEFERKNPDIKINLIHIPDNYFQKLHLLVASNLAPDVIFINNLNSRIYINAGKIEPLDDYIKNMRDEFLDNALSPFIHKGSLYAIPRDVSNMIIYYNKDIFDKYSVPYPSDNWTIKEFLVTAQKLTKDTNNDTKTDIFGFGFEKNSIFWLPFLLSNGGGILSTDENKIILNSKASLDSLQFYSDLRNRYHVTPRIDEQASLTTSQLFLQGKIAMHLCGRWCSITYKKNADFNWDIVQFPRGSAGSIVGLDASGWAISSSSKHKPEAWKFIEFMSSSESMKVMSNDGLIFPTRKVAAAALLPPPNNLSVFFKALNNSQRTPLCIKYAEINDILNEVLEPVFDGKKQVSDAISKNLIKKLETKLD